MLTFTVFSFNKLFNINYADIKESQNKRVNGRSLLLLLYLRCIINKQFRLNSKHLSKTHIKYRDKTKFPFNQTHFDCNYFQNL